MAVDSLEQIREALRDRYHVISELGRGGMSRVYLADDRKLDRRVAVKVLTKARTHSVGIDRFALEVKIAASLSHPHIVPLYDSGEVGGCLYYVMPHVEGESLRQLLDEEAQLPLKQTLRIARELLDALAYAHGKGIVHRDIKPANVLLSDGHAWITDFGIARALALADTAPLTESGDVIGTPLYMSPEQATGAGDLDHRADLYSLGCVIYEMLCGAPPYTGTSAQTIIARHVADTIPLVGAVRPTVPDHVGDTIYKSMAKAPVDRHQSAKEMQRGLSGGGDQGRGPQKWLIAAAGLVVAIGGFFAWRATIEPEPDETQALPAASIAVLPFEDLTPNAEFDWLAGALTHELINALAPVEGLDVRAYQSTRWYAGRTTPLDSIAGELQVGTIVDGNVEVLGSDARVTVYLLDPVSGLSLSDPFRATAPLSSVDSLRFEIVENVALALRASLGDHVTIERWRSETGSGEAWTLLSQSVERYEAAEDARVLGQVVDAFEFLSEADSLAQLAGLADPSWVEVKLHDLAVRLRLARVANAAELRAALDEIDTAELQRIGAPDSWLRDALERATGLVEIYQDVARAHELRGHVLYRLRAHVADDSAALLLQLAEQDFRRAVSIDAQATGAWLGLSYAAGSQGDFRTEEMAAERALETDSYLSLGERGLYERFFSALRQGSLDQARALCATGRARFPEPHPDMFLNCRLAILGFSGGSAEDVAESASELALVEAAGPTEPSRWVVYRAWHAYVLARAGQADSATAVAEATRRGLDEDVDRTVLFSEASLSVLLGETDQALERVARYLELRPDRRDFIGAHAWMAPLRSHPEFQRLVAPPANQTEGGPASSS